MTVQGPRLVLFDMDGVLADTVSSWVSVHDHFRVSNEENFRRFSRGDIDEMEFIRSDVGLWKSRKSDVSIDDLRSILDRVPLMAGAMETVRELKREGVRTAIISGGIDILADRVRAETGIDLALANGLVCDAGGRLTGEGILRVRIRDKGESAREVMSMLGVRMDECASVGDTATDIPLFRNTRMGIAFNPAQREVEEEADYTVRGRDLTGILDCLKEWDRK